MCFKRFIVNISENMKIAFIGGRDIRKLGGIESYMYNLATELVRKGHEPIVYCESDHCSVEWINGFKVIYQKGPKSMFLCKPLLGLKSTINAVFREKHIDVIHYNAWPPALSSPLACVFGIKSVMQGHGHEWKNTKYSMKQKKILRFMEWLSAKMNKNVITVSNAQSDYYNRNYRKNVVTIPTAINPPALVEDKMQFLNKYGLLPKKYFLVVARIVPVKNIDVLINAFIKSNHSDYKLVIAGNNDANPEYVNSLKLLASQSNDIIFTGVVYGEEKTALIENSYTFCIPSTSEGLSVALLEAMGLSVPIIASDIEGNREVLQDDKAVWVRAENEQDLCSAIEYSITHEIEIFASTEFNRNLILENYTWEKVTDKYVDYLTDLFFHRK